jgi:hypothetical protein
MLDSDLNDQLGEGDTMRDVDGSPLVDALRGLRACYLVLVGLAVALMWARLLT